MACVNFSCQASFVGLLPSYARAQSGIVPAMDNVLVALMIVVITYLLVVGVVVGTLLSGRHD